MKELTALLTKLISYPSITPEDAGCQDFMVDYLAELGFRIHRFDCAPVSNFYAEIGTGSPCLVFAGHTDVVDIGHEEQWHTPPFEATVIDGQLHGRGAADMKGSLAAMMVMAKQLVNSQQTLNGRLGFLITSGEEGDQFDLGTPHVMQQLQQAGISIDYCVVGEPSSTSTIGDVVKIGRRGSLTADVKIIGKQGHVAYPHLAKNPIHLVTKALDTLCHTNWDAGNDYFPPTTFQVSNINAGTGAGNVIPGTMTFKFNFRYSTETSDEKLKSQVNAILDEFCANHYEINWRLNGKPFLTAPGRLIAATTKAINTHCKLDAELSTSGGTSDARFIAPYGIEVIELGPVNATIHQVNENTNIDELSTLCQVYQSIVQSLI